MIEKLKKQNTWGECLEKLNEVINAVNKLETMAKNTNTVLESLIQENNIHEKQIDELQMKLEPEKCETPADPYAEQRKWIGKICRFWYSNKKYADLGILQVITPANTPNKYLKKGSCNWYSNCEPVKPDDDIIYKGGNND